MNYYLSMSPSSVVVPTSSFIRTYITTSYEIVFRFKKRGISKIQRQGSVDRLRLLNASLRDSLHCSCSILKRKDVKKERSNTLKNQWLRALNNKFEFRCFDKMIGKEVFSFRGKVRTDESSLPLNSGTNVLTWIKVIISTQGLNSGRLELLTRHSQSISIKLFTPNLRSLVA